MSQPGTFGILETMKESSEKRGDWWKEYSATYKHPAGERYNETYNKIDYKFDEDQAIKELKKYIDSTYDGHYSKNKFQSMEFIVDCSHGDGFCMGNIIKYAQRYGKKEGKNKKDLLKIMHYAIIALSILDNGDK
jgi:hypothetical protein|tara:strand:+ start:1021 stop:1422 length:402 start_codon:yes stop_codon:yes gene_type:complete